ncbi:MAG: class I SAM-dependent methyltransferase [Methanoculleus sp.]
MAVDYISLWVEQHERANRRKEIWNDGRSFWEDPRNIRRFVDRLMAGEGSRVEGQLAAMQIPVGSTVLDIGAGPGSLAVPLALAGCRVTVVEPSAGMRAAMEEYREAAGAPEIRVIPSRWEDADPGEVGRHDVVVASFSLGLDDIDLSLKKIDSAAKRAVHLFWFLTPPAWTRANIVLWPELHGGEFAFEPTADLLWNCLCQLEIHPNITVEHVKKGQCYPTMEEVVADYCRRLHVRDDDGREIVTSFVRERLMQTEAGFCVPGTSKTAHIWWEKGSREPDCARWDRMCHTDPGTAIDYISLWDGQHARSLAQKEKMGEGSGKFWSNQDVVDRFVRNLISGDRSRIEDQIAGMLIPPGSSVLDIGAGPGTLAVPLALAGCRVTVVEPSVPMGEAMEDYRRMVNAPAIRAIRSRWEDVSPEEAGVHDVVVASRSLSMGDIRDSLLKMDAAARRAVHLYWFLPSLSGAGGSVELWPALHGEPYCEEAGADVLWNALCQIGIYADLQVETKGRRRCYSSLEELKQDYYNRLSATEDWQREIVDAFLLERAAPEGSGHVVPGHSRSVHIWWEKE